MKNITTIAILIILLSIVKSKNVKDPKGNDFFPIGWYTTMVHDPEGKKHLSKIADDDFANCAIIYPGNRTNITQIRKYFKLAKENGIYLIPSIINKAAYGRFLNPTNLNIDLPGDADRNENYIDSILTIGKDYGNFLGWYHFDEAANPYSQKKINCYPSLMKLMNDSLKKFDNSIQTFTTNYKADQWLWDYTEQHYYPDGTLMPVDNSKWRKDVERNGKYPFYYDATDVIMLDLYPIVISGKFKKKMYFEPSFEKRKNYFPKKFPIYEGDDIWLNAELRNFSLDLNKLTTELKNRNIDKPVISIIYASESYAVNYKVKRDSDGRALNKKDNTKLAKKIRDLDYIKKTEGLLGKSIEHIREVDGEKYFHYDELLYMTYSALVHNAKGLIFYAKHRAPQELQIKIRKICNTLLQLNIDKLVLSDPNIEIRNNSIDKDKNGLKDINCKLWFDKKESCYYLLTVNDSKEFYDDLTIQIPFKAKSILANDFYNKTDNGVDFKTKIKIDNDFPTEINNLKLKEFEVKLFKIII